MSNKSDTQKFKLDDSSIAHIVKLIQLGFITGTDVVDHFRMIQFVSDDSGSLHLEPDYEKNQTANIEKMLAQASESMQESEEA